MQIKCLLCKKQPALHCPLYIKRHCFISSSSTILQHIIMKVGSRVFSAITLLITCFQHFAPHHTTVVYLTFQRPKYFRERNGKRPCAMEEYIVSKIFRATMSTSWREKDGRKNLWRSKVWYILGIRNLILRQFWTPEGDSGHPQAILDTFRGIY